MLAYKGFKPGLVCLGYQFAMGLNVTDKANCRANGFHCAENPLDCLSYYSDMSRSEYYLVDAGGDIDEDGHDSKIACTHLTILHKLDLKDFLLHALAYMADHPRRTWNHHVQKGRGVASGGYAIVRGIDPVASGNKGDYLALAKDDPCTGDVVQVSLFQVDGSVIRPNIWYNIDASKVR